MLHLNSRECISIDAKEVFEMDWARVGALNGALAIVTGAFGAHGLKKFNVTPASLKTWETAAHYHLVHAVALFAAGATNRLTERTGWMFMTGITLFSGSLYMLVLTGKSLPWGPITPIGGLTLVGAWLALAATPGPGKGSE